VPALVRRNRNPLHVFLDAGVDNLSYISIVTKMYYLSAAGLENPAHDIDGRIVTIKQAGRRHKTDLMFRFVQRVMAISLLTGSGWLFNVPKRHGF